MQLTFSEKASIMPQYATDNAAKEAGVRARFLFHFSFAVRFSVFSPVYQCCALIIMLCMIIMRAYGLDFENTLSPEAPAPAFPCFRSLYRKFRPMRRHIQELSTACLCENEF